MAAAVSVFNRPLHIHSMHTPRVPVAEVALDWQLHEFQDTLVFGNSCLHFYTNRGDIHLNWHALACTRAPPHTHLKTPQPGVVALAFNSSLSGAEAEGLPRVQGPHSKFHTSLGYRMRSCIIKLYHSAYHLVWGRFPTLYIALYIIYMHIYINLFHYFYKLFLKVKLWMGIHW